MKRQLGLLGACVLAACAGTRTGNPDDGPTYESGSRFMDEPNGFPTGGHDEPGSCWPTGIAPFQLAGGDFARLFGDDRLVAAIDERGIVVVDVADPSDPRVEGELPIDGTPLQLAVDADGAGATLAVLEYNALDGADIPTGDLPDRSVRLVRIDLGDPSRPRRAYDLEVSDTYWQLEARGSRVFLVEQVLAARTPSACGTNLLIDFEECPTPTSMRITGYDVGDDAFVERESVQIAADWSGAFYADDTFFVVSNLSGSEAGTEPILTWVEFGSGALVERGTVTLPTLPTAFDREGDTAAVLLEDRIDASLSLALLDLAASGAGALRGALDLSGNLTAVSIDPRGFVSVEGALVHLVDASDLDAPVLASTLPNDVKRLVPTGAGSLGFGSADGSEAPTSLVVSLWNLDDPANPVRVDDVATDWFVQSDAAPWTVDEANGRLLLPFNRPPGGPDDSFDLAILSFDAASLAIESEQPSRLVQWHNLFRPLTDGTSVFAPSYAGLEVFPVDVSAVETEPRSAFLPFRDDALDVLDVSGTRISLHERKLDGVFYVEVEPNGGTATTIELDHRGDALVEVDGAVAVLGLRGEAVECESFADAGIEIPELDPNPQDGVDPCAMHRMRGVSVISLVDTPSLVETFPIVSTMDVEPIAGVSVRADWPGYVRLSDGRLALFAQRSQNCDSYESCAVLGVPAYESMGSPGCNPQVQDCDALPSIEIFVNGYKATLGVYVLDGAGSDAPTLTLGPVLDGRFDLDGEATLDQSWRALDLDHGFAFAREEPIYDDEGNSVANERGDSIVRWYLERVRLADDGSLAALPPVNTPGRPVALDGDLLYSVDPGYDEDGRVVVELHRSALRDDGAHIEESVPLGAGFVDLRAVGEHLFILRGPEDWCAEDAVTALFAVSLATLELGDTLELPGVTWSFAFAEPALDAEGRLVLRGGPLPSRGRLYLDVTDPLTPRIDRYATE